MVFSRLTSFFSFASLALLTAAAPSSLNTFQARNDVAAPKTVHFELNVTWGEANPTNGVARKVIFGNGQFPSPPLVMTVGDTVEFLVHNNIDNNTAIHFHGIVQVGTPWSDGVPGVTQKPIESGRSYMYKWTADAAGTYFYHAHYKGQMMDGLYGAILIHPKESDPRPFNFISNDTTDLKNLKAAEYENYPILASDWSQYTFEEFHHMQVEANIDNACADAFILNGKGSVYCLSRAELTQYTNPKLPALLAAVNPPQLTDKGCIPPNLPATQGNFTFNLAALPAPAYFQCTATQGEMEVVEVDAAKGWFSLTFINPGNFAAYKVTIDGHKMWVYQVDGNYVIPQKVDQITVYNGDRYSVMIKLDQPAADYAIRLANNGLNQVLSGFGILRYKGSTGPAQPERSIMNYAGVNTTVLVPFNEKKAAPFPPVSPSLTADVSVFMNIKKLGRPAGAWEWTLGGVEAYSMENDDVPVPLLLEDPAKVVVDNVTFKTNKGQWVDMIIRTQGPIAQPHPIHKHSNKAFVIGSGVGTWNWSSVAEAQKVLPNNTFNFVNPPYRDGFTTQAADGNSAWTVVRYHVENPGPFIMHCHMETHFSGGMAVVMLDGVDDWPEVPQEYAEGSGFVLDKKVKIKHKN